MHMGGAGRGESVKVEESVEVGAEVEVEVGGVGSIGWPARGVAARVECKMPVGTSSGGWVGGVGGSGRETAAQQASHPEPPDFEWGSLKGGE